MIDVAHALTGARAAGHSRLDADLLLLLAMGFGATELTARRGWLLAHDTDTVEAFVVDRFQRLLERRRLGEPIAYITGHKEFFGLDLLIDPRGLVPRPDTEVLVQWALDVLDHADVGRDAPLRLLDLGTGSGAIALAVKHCRPKWRVDAVDVGAEALALARSNAFRLGLDLGWMQGSWFAPVVGHYDCIASNPPYVEQDDPHLVALRHEPLQALVSGNDGLDDIRIIVATAPGYVKLGGWLLLEHGFDQGPAVRRLMQDAGFANIASRNDLAGHWRCTGGQQQSVP